MKKPGANRYRLFVSSVQKELASERRAVKDFVTHDPLLGRFISDVFLFEELPAGDRKPDDIYLAEVKACDIYIAISGNEYGWKNDSGKSPTELEFEHATKTHRERLIFVKGDDDKARAPEMADLVRRAGSQVTRRRFSDIPNLIREVYASLVESLEQRGAFRSRPFDGSICEGATLRDLDNIAISDFVETAEAAGRLKLKGSRASKAVLQNFNLLRDGSPTNAAMLLFGKDPRRFFNNIQVHCFHFHGTEKLKPIASQQPYEGRLIEVIDDAVEKAGTGTTDMIADCRKAGLPELDFEQRGPYLVVTVWRDRLTEDVIASLGLNDRQKTAVLFTKQNGRITNKQYQELSKVTDRTVLRDIQELVNKMCFIKLEQRVGPHIMLSKRNPT